ncbi:MAG: LVIVD repeat-containing protein [Actinomycetota bacterium]
MSLTRKMLAIVGGLLLVIPAGAAAGTSGSDEVPDFQAGEIEHVANIPFGGSDIEFASRVVTKLSGGATGDPVCKKDASGACLVDGSGDTIYETEVRDFAVAGGYPASSGGARIIDITDPRNPVAVGLTPCAISQNDIQIQGDLLLVAADGNYSCKRPDGGNQPVAGTAVLDFSDPRNPTYISRLQYSRGSHNHTFVPGKPIVYLSDSDVASAGLGNIPIWDISDPLNPVMKFEFKLGAHSPHDITFNESGTRAYVAAVSLTYILNTENPIAPTLVSVIPNEGISISHQADPTPDGDYLLVSDELGGGAAGLSPGGPVHVYDIRNELRPVKVGIIENDCAPHVCHPLTDTIPTSTSHVFRINPDGYTMAIAWYKDGLGVIDFSSIRGANVAGTGTTSKFGAQVVAWIRMPNANTWAAKMWMERHPGYVFTNDIRRGFDVFYVPSMGPGFVAKGTIDAGHPGTYDAGTGITRTEFETDCAYTPRANGVDAWVAKVPEALADGNHTMYAKGAANAAFYDLDMVFYDKDCNVKGTVGEIDVDTSGPIPAGTAYVLTSNWLGETVNLTLSAGITPP